MRKSIIIAAIAVFTGIGFVGCSKSDDSGETPQQIDLTNTKWKLVKYVEYDFNGKVVQTTPISIEGCPDDVFVFLPNQKSEYTNYEKLDGKCHKDVNSLTGWKIVNGALVLIDTRDKSERNYKILKYTDTELETEYTVKKGDTEFELNTQKVITYYLKVK